MRDRLVYWLVILLLAVPFSTRAREKTRLMEGYDPRVPLQVMVLPATLASTVKKADPRVVSGILETEMLRIYEVQSLRSVEQYLLNSKQSLATAFSMKGLPVLKDSAHVDAVVHLNVYRWEKGTPGMLFLGSKGIIGLKITLADPYNGKILWSLNRTESVKESDSFFECITTKFKEIINDVKKDMETEANRLTREEKDAEKRAKKIQEEKLKTESTG